MASEPFIGEIMIFAGNFNPRGWALCDGALLPIASNTALFSLLGTTYGGNGTTNFALPDFRGRAPMHFGQGPGLTNHPQGQNGGTETSTLLATNIPAHTHPIATTATIPCRSGAGSTDNPTGAIPASTATHENYATPSPATGAMSIAVGGNTGQAGAAQPFNNLQPYLTLNFCIALQGIFPPRP